MNEAIILQKTEQVLSSVKQLGLYKLLFSQKVAFCFVILFVMTGVVIFSSWAVVNHFIDPSTYGTVIITFGGVITTIAGIYNIIHGMNDRATMAIQSAIGIQAPTTSIVQSVPDANLPPNGTV
jgi:hypothetical protein